MILGIELDETLGFRKHRRMSIAELRTNYSKGGLRRHDLLLDPMAQFKKWFDEAIQAEILEPNAMTLATVDQHGQPSCRVVLLKIADDRGFSFFTNYTSRKGEELARNSHAALNFFWPTLERQICIRGECSRLSREESQTYFSSRPVGSQLGAWVSNQSMPVPDREFLEAKLDQVSAQFKSQPIPVPDQWGGYALRPISIEFWQGRPDRLHDRFRYSRLDGTWLIERLSP